MFDWTVQNHKTFGKIFFRSILLEACLIIIIFVAMGPINLALMRYGRSAYYCKNCANVTSHTLLIWQGKQKSQKNNSTKCLASTSFHGGMSGGFSIDPTLCAKSSCSLVHHRLALIAGQSVFGTHLTIYLRYHQWTNLRSSHSTCKKSKTIRNPPNNAQFCYVLTCESHFQQIRKNRKYAHIITFFVVMIYSSVNK